MGAPSTRQSKPLMWFFFFFFGLAYMFICSIFDLVISILKPGHFPNHPNFSLLLKSLELGLYWACIPLGRLIGEQHGGQGRGRPQGWRWCWRLCRARSPSLARALLQVLSADRLPGANVDLKRGTIPGAQVQVKVAQSCLTLCDPMDFIVHGLLQARILEWVAFPFSRGSS